MSITNLVKMMHTKFGITSEEVPFSEEEKKFRICAMQEELDEYKEAETKEDQLDALVDLVVFAMGTAERQGMLEVFDEAFKRVMLANCKKEIGQNQKRGSFQLDLVKPEGWTAPDLSDLVLPPQVYKYKI
jgi:predicted HAD superfamily Cof-like phosphohydrolase